MHPTLLPAGAAVMIEILGAVAVAAGGFAVWLWRANRRLAGPLDRR